MGFLLLSSIIAIFYNLAMFWYEGGFTFIISSRMFWLIISIMFLLMQLNILTIFNVITRMNLFENNINREIFNGPRRQIDNSREQREKKYEYFANKHSNKPTQKFKYISNERKYNYDEEVNSEEEQYNYENNY